MTEVGKHFTEENEGNKVPLDFCHQRQNKVAGNLVRTNISRFVPFVAFCEKARFFARITKAVAANYQFRLLQLFSSSVLQPFQTPSTVL
jgi:hypothetical protein